MPRQVVPLTNTQVLSLKAADTPISKFDGGGLFLLVQPGGGKWWRFKYTCERDPANDLQGALRVPVVKHHAALSASELPAFLKALDDPLAHIAALTRLALKLIVMTATRPGELRMAQWQEFDFERAEWRVPAERMCISNRNLVTS